MYGMIGLSGTFSEWSRIGGDCLAASGHFDKVVMHALSRVGGRALYKIRKKGSEPFSLKRALTPLFSALVQSRNTHGDFHRLLVVETWVHGGLVGPGQVAVRKPPCAARALGDVLARELEVHAAEVGSRLLVPPGMQPRAPSGFCRSGASSHHRTCSRYCHASGRKSRVRANRSRAPPKSTRADAPRPSWRRNDGSA